MTASERTKINDPALMRALAHPARLELLDHLSIRPEGATATECAAVIRLSPSATSYHLRALAKVGMIHEAPSRGDGRERIWQATQRSYEVSGDRDATPDVIEAEAAIVEAVLARQNETVRQYLGRARQDLPDWFEIARISDFTLQATPAELKDILTKIDELVEPLKQRNRANFPEESRPVSLQIRAVPRAL